MIPTFSGFWELPVTVVKGIGPSRLTMLSKMGISRIHELLFHFPRYYQDRRPLDSLSALSDGSDVTVKVRVMAGWQQKKAGRLVVTQLPIGDDSGEALAVWFNQAHIHKSFAPGATVYLTGTAKRRYGQWQIVVKECNNEDQQESSFLTPIYPSTKGLSQKLLRRWMQEATALAQRYLMEPWPKAWVDAQGLPSLVSAIREAHFPSSWEMLALARRRLVFDELLTLQLMLNGRQDRVSKAVGIRHLGSGSDCLAVVSALFEQVSYQPTVAQFRVIGEIIDDMEAPYTMRRVLQGDVGSGKTMVAAAALVKAAWSGRQAALLVPTEILAEQHHSLLTGLLAPLGINVCLFTGSLRKKERTLALDKLARQEVQVVVGTQSLLGEDVTIPMLSLVVVDEEHRFGVAQQDKLVKDTVADLLAISATPIPRSLALIVYGDMKISVLDQMPPSRSTVKTYWVGKEKEQGLIAYCRRELEQGRQVFWVCPSIDSQYELSLSSVEQRIALLQEAWQPFKVSALHGRLLAGEKDRVMRGFSQGQINALVATSMVEVGIDVPNATVMVIEDAHFFGLAQLHQLRGRVGRGTFSSICVLLAEPDNKTAQERLRMMVKSSDGFSIAQADLELRGPGEILGERQHGFSHLLAFLWEVSGETIEHVRTLALQVNANKGLLSDQQWAWLHSMSVNRRLL